MTPHEQWLFRKAFTLGFKATREGFNGECPYPHIAPDSVFDMSECCWGTYTEYEAEMASMPEFVRLQEEALVVFATINDSAEGNENASTMSLTVNGNHMDMASFLPPKFVKPTSPSPGKMSVSADGESWTDLQSVKASEAHFVITANGKVCEPRILGEMGNRND